MDTLVHKSGAIPFLVDVLLQEDSETIRKLYKKMTSIEKQFLFDRANVPLEKAFSIENQIKQKISNICKRYERNRKT